MKALNCLLMARKGVGYKRDTGLLLANQFRVRVDLPKNNHYFYHYNVVMNYKDENQVEAKGIGRKVLKYFSKTFCVEMHKFCINGKKSFVYKWKGK